MDQKDTGFMGKGNGKIELPRLAGAVQKKYPIKSVRSEVSNLAKNPKS
jgi:hypothetical protein